MSEPIRRKAICTVSDGHPRKMWLNRSRGKVCSEHDGATRLCSNVCKQQCLRTLCPRSNVAPRHGNVITSATTRKLWKDQEASSWATFSIVREARGACSLLASAFSGGRRQAREQPRETRNKLGPETRMQQNQHRKQFREGGG